MLACSVQASIVAELEDAAARVQYAFYAQDERALRSAIADLEKLTVPAEYATRREYQLGIAHWRLADLGANGNNTRSAALGRCENHLSAALRDEPRHAEALAVRTLCAYQRNDLLAAGARALKRSCRRQSALQKALELRPRNPRVLFVEAWCAEKDGDISSAVELAERAAAAFAEEQLAPGDHAAWGQADTSLFLAQLQLRLGNRAAARDRVEQALILAPDYVAARELLTQIAGGR
jgi:tetratricopeptide (TPR) repeat protein